MLRGSTERLRVLSRRLLLACTTVSLTFQPCPNSAESPVVVGAPQDLPGISEGQIRIDFEVTDLNGNPVTGLNRDDIALLDNGKPTNMSTFLAVSDAAPPKEPVELILVIDLVDLNSQTNKTKGDAAEAAIERFLRRNSGKLDHPVSVYVLTRDGLSGSAEPVKDGNALAQMIADHSLPRRARSPADAIFHIMPLQAETLGAIALEQRTRRARKVLIWTGPGWAVSPHKDDRLFLGIVELYTRLREARITVWGASQWPYPRPGEDPGTSLNPEFAEELNDYGWPQFRVDVHYPEYMAPVKTAGDAHFGNVALAVLAAHTGGGMRITRSIANAIEKLAANANAYYSITFDPARTSQVDEYHQLKLEVARNNLTAHALSCYYDEPAYHDQRPEPSERLNVAQLEAILTDKRSGRDRELAKELESAELTERLNPARLDALRAELPGSRSQEALKALADRSAFRPPPTDEVLPDPAPAAAEQDRILAQAVGYVKDVLSRLPNLFATRTTAQFNEPGIKQEAGAWKEVSADESLHLTQTTKTTVLFRNGAEAVDKAHKVSVGEHNLATEGTFGPILEIVLSRAEGAHTQLGWSRWERGHDAPVAVFRYAVAKRSGGLEVHSCCGTDAVGSSPMESQAGFHGEVALDPASGTILRLTMEADLEPQSPITQSAVMVEYAGTTIGGKTCTCPIHSIAISRQRIEWALHEWSENFVVYGRYETLLNDVTFSNFHLFRSESTILPGYVLNDNKQ